MPSASVKNKMKKIKRGHELLRSWFSVENRAGQDKTFAPASRLSRGPSGDFNLLVASRLVLRILCYGESEDGEGNEGEAL